jgi:hypothetical protein
VRHPGGFDAEWRYVLDVVLSDWLGLTHAGFAEDRADVEITMADGADGRVLFLPDAFFRRAGAAWLEPGSLPATPLPRWRAGDDLKEIGSLVPEVPVLHGGALEGGRRWLRPERGGGLRLGIDLLGSIFFLLTRYEEQIPGAPRDRHGRFAGAASLAAREGFLERPLANEYLEILWACLRRLWPRLERRRRSYAVALSHDIDRPFTQGGWWRLGRSVAADLLRRRSPGLAARRAALPLRGGGRRWRADPNNTFALIMEASERLGLRSTFYVKGGCTDPRYDDDYPLEAEPVGTLLREIHARGHELGLHPSYRTWRDPGRIAAELARLTGAAERLGIRQDAWGGRQHYLRFQAPQTWRHYEAAGLVHDATLGFADRVGFRCGTCYEFPVFDLALRRPLRLRERPLVVMEGSLLGTDYMGLTPEPARVLIAHLASACRAFRGTFSLLWHNTELATRWQKSLYARVLEDIAGR